MGPITLFDKSFLQSLTVDESVWFGHFFLPVVCPLFYVESLADLSKEVRPGRTSEREVAIIADKFPEASASPCTHHSSMALAELHGHDIPMDSRIPRPGGRIVERDGKLGVVFDESPEARAFSRWQAGQFFELERSFAITWRAMLKHHDLDRVAKSLRDIGIDGRTCKHLSEAKILADAVVTGRETPYARMGLVIELLGIPREHHHSIAERWANHGYPSLVEYSPYVAHLTTVEIFFHIALAASLIGPERASNRVDIAYLNYLPFSTLFVSSDKLHRRCAPEFLRDDQEFVWGPDLKADLARINQHFLGLPDDVKERGIMAFAHVPPKTAEPLVRGLWERFLRPGYVEESEARSPPESTPQSKKLVAELNEWTKAPEAPDATLEGEPETLSIQRVVRRRKGSWWQVPKDLSDEDAD